MATRMTFWIPWSVACLFTLTCVYFLLVGLVDGSVSSFNGGLWTTLLALCLGVTGGSYALKQSGRTGLAAVLSPVLALPGALFALFLLLTLLMNPRWN